MADMVSQNPKISSNSRPKGKAGEGTSWKTDFGGTR
jgi:hypothetical protein